MKKILLSTFAVASLFATAQNPTSLVEEMDGSTPCFLTWDPVGAFQGAAGHDFTSMVYDDSQEDGIMTFSAKTHASQHGPLYYTLSAGDDQECFPAEGAVDISGNPKAEIRIKASSNVKINVYIQEGNSPSWDYSKFSASSFQIDVTTDWQFVTLENIADSSGGGAAVDLSNIGGVAFELGKTDGVNFDNIDGTVSVDFIRFGDAANSTEEVVVEGFNVFPNPATDVLNVKFDATSATTVELTDLTGKVVSSQLVQAGAVNTTFATADINAGIYFVNVKNEIGSTTQKVVIK
ncbi:MAG: hypothetical protein CMD35_03750 [Flavobacteriales bacterium]|nr:hypothetical protein [Flavobacteriales bacterium]